MKKKFKFEDIEFLPHPTGSGEQFKTMFNNGYGVSVLFGYPFYSDGIETYELAVLDEDGLCYDTYITDDVLGYLTEDELVEAINKVKELPKDVTLSIEYNE